MFNFKERIIDAVFETIANIVSSIVGATIDLMMEIMVSLITLMVDPTDWPLVNDYIFYAQLIATTLLATKIAYDSLTIYIIRSSGEPNIDGGGMIGRAIISVVVIYLIPFLVQQMFKFGFLLAGGVVSVGSAGGFGEIKNTYDSVIITLAYATQDLIMGIIITLLILIVGALFSIIIMLQMMVRSAELVLMSIVGPFAAVGIGGEFFSTWWKKILSLSVGFSVQLLMFRLSFYTLEWLPSGVASEKFQFFFLIGFLWATIKSPRVLEGLIEATGMGRVAGSAGQMIMMRKMLTGGRG